MPTAVELNNYFDTVIPASLGFSWDSGGIALLTDNRDHNRIVVALDVTLGAIEYAKKVGAGIIVSHHPAIFGNINTIRYDDASGNRLILAAQNGISLLGYHTRLDNAEGGVNDTLCNIIGVKDYYEFQPCARLGNLEKETTPEEYGEFIAKALNSKRVNVFANNKKVSRVAVCSGSGGDIVKSAYLAGADTVVTGEAKYNYELDAAEYGINLITAGHKETEQIIVPVIKDIINKGFPTAEVFEYYA